MTKILNLPEIIQCLDRLESPAAREIRASLTSLVETAADMIADRLGVEHGLADLLNGHLTVAFRPSHEGQEMPEILENYDTTGDWE